MDEYKYGVALFVGQYVGVQTSLILYREAGKDHMDWISNEGLLVCIHMLAVAYNNATAATVRTYNCRF